jgi:SAM-dependent methyltransferase/uncharacterized protein YbaR (Trm112 family)
MLRSHFAAWAPHCPVCARDRGLAPALALAEGAQERDGDVLAGILVCADAGCRQEYPIIDGIPVIMPDLRRHLGERAIELLLRDDLDPAVQSLLGDALGPDSWFDIIRQGVSTYAWDSYADLDPAEQVGAVLPGAARRCLAELLDLVRPWQPGAAPMLDLGCGGGRTSFDLAAAGTGLVLGIDANLALLRLARRVAKTGRGHYARRRVGTVYDGRAFQGALPGRERVDFWACDALALPFAPQQMGLVAALNLLDCVADPRRLLDGMARLIKPNGALLLATPFDWSTRATAVTEWIGGHSQRGTGEGAPVPMLRTLLTEGAHRLSITGLEIVGEGESSWHTRLHERSAVQYRSHLVALRNGEMPLHW